MPHLPGRRRYRHRQVGLHERHHSRHVNDALALDELKMIMIDPKVVELSQFQAIPHLMHPVISDMKKAEAVLAWAVDKMEERYDLLGAGSASS